MRESVALACAGGVFACIAITSSAIHIDHLFKAWRGETYYKHKIAICAIIPV